MKFLIFLTVALSFLGFHEKSPIPIKPTKIERPRNIILVIGDGMGLSQISGALLRTKLPFSLESFPVIGFQKTYSANNLVTDSAAAGTALSSGKKTNNNVLGLDKDGKPCQTILEEAIERGYATGMVVNSSIQHATPGSFIAHQPARNLYEDITIEILNSGIDLFIGGGKQHFDHRDNDDRNIIEELKVKGYKVYDYSTTEIKKIVPDTTMRFAYFTAEKEPTAAILGRNYLPYASKIAANYLAHRGKKGFFMMVEGSQIDWACHSNKTEALYAEMQDFDETLKQLLKFARKDGETLLIVTADHETGGFALNGSTPNSLSPKFTTNGHTAAMVPVFAYGPKSELFRGIYENIDIHKKMRQAFGFSEN